MAGAHEDRCARLLQQLPQLAIGKRGLHRDARGIPRPDGVVAQPGLGSVLVAEPLLRLVREHDRASELRAHRADLVGRALTDVDDRSLGHPIQRRSPRLGVGDQRRIPRRDHLGRELVERPSPTELEGLEPGVGQPPLGEAVSRPLRGPIVLGRAGQAWPVDVGQRVEEIERLRALHPLVDQPQGHLGIDGDLGRGRGRAAQDRGEQEQGGEYRGWDSEWHGGGSMRANGVGPRMGFPGRCGQ
ncbi:MAG: hypothetical protein KJP18_01945 [Gemmatimonadetes bacterium]|nr:hypothetical protein [Gemmatimonadota bacterium]